MAELRPLVRSIGGFQALKPFDRALTLCRQHPEAEMWQPAAATRDMFLDAAGNKMGAKHRHSRGLNVLRPKAVALRAHERAPPPRFSHEQVSPDEVRRVRELNEQHQYIKLSFKDNGIGFDQQYAEKVFTIFQRLNHKKAYAGSGIGLALCKRIVENHHGLISASSQPDKGTMFFVYLPVATGG